MRSDPTVVCNTFNIVEPGADGPKALVGVTLSGGGPVSAFVDLSDARSASAITVRADRFTVNGAEVTLEEWLRFLEWSARAA